MTRPKDDEPLTFQQYAERKMMMSGLPWMHVKEAVASTALEHPEWADLPPRSFNEWEKVAKK